MTPLARRIARMIRADGPMSLGHYMALCLGDAEHGYYMTRDPFGASGDFTTAPEVSQMFGELIGLWAVDTWMKLGRPAPFSLVELGPGRGTLMADALRAAGALPAFLEAASVRLVETSPVLKDYQSRTLAEAPAPVAWHAALEDVPTGPLIAVANEFFDALPIVQYERAGGHWRERVVVLDADGRFAVGLGEPVPSPDPASLPDAPDGAIRELAPAREAVVSDLAARLASNAGAALVIDYGHAKSGFGDTLQAVRGHKPVSIFEAPGECDLTSHVDFEALASAAGTSGAHCHGTIEMGAFLLSLGIAERAARLKAGKAETIARDIDAALARLTAAEQMGSLFKVLAITSPGAPAPEPFATNEAAR